VLLAAAGATLGVRLDAARWLELAGLIMVGLAPFVVIGLILGYLVPMDAMAPALGGVVLVFALFGGVFGRLFNAGAMLRVEQLLPSYWLVQAGRAALGGSGWPAEGWLVLAAWTAALIPLAALVFRRAASVG
jgi:ABC-2 type transport system permease protein